MKYFSSLFLLIAYTIAIGQSSSCGFGYKKTITINGGQVTGGAHTDFPVLISHTDPDLTTAAGKVTSASGFDIVFADNSGNLLDFQLEDYNGATGEYVAWVKIPSITNGTDLDIHMLYGKASIVTDQSTTNTWSAGYDGVWHLHGDVNDYSGNGYNATNNGSTNLVGNGFTADGQDFQDPNDWLELNSGTSFPNISTGSFTITGWIKSNDVTRAGQRVFCDDANNSTGGFALSLGDGGAGRLRFYMRGTSPVVIDSPGGIIANGTWYHVAIVQDAAGTRRSIYVDGALVANNGAVTIPGSADAGNASIGGEVAAGEAANRFHGTLDEIRAFGGVLSANWLATEYASQSQPTTTVGVVTAGDFYTVGAEEDIFHTSAANNDWDNVATTWDSGQLPDGFFETVVINHDVDIDGGGANYTVCDCQINGTGASLASLDISANSLSVTEDLSITLTGAGVNHARVLLTNAGILNVSGDVNLTSTNTNTTSNIQFLTRNTSVANVTGDLIGSNGAGGDIHIDLEETSDINITGNLDLTQTGGDDIRIILDDASTLDVTGDLLLTDSGGDDIILAVNQNSGTSASTNITGDILCTINGGDDIQFRPFQTSSLIHTNSDLTVNQSSGGRMNFNVDGTGTIDIDGTLTINQTGDADDGRMRVASAGALINVDTDFIVNISGGNNDRFFIDMDNGQIQVDGNMDFNLTGGTNDCDIDVDIDGVGIINVGGNFTADLTDGDDIDLRMGFNVAGSTGAWNVTGDFVLTQNVAVGGKSIGLEILENSVLTIDGEFELNQLNIAGDLLLVHADDNGRIDCNDDIDINAAGSGDIEIRLDGTSELQIFGDFDRTPSSFGELDMATTATIEFNSSTAAQVFPQDAGAGGDIFDYGIVEINNSFGVSPQITLEGLATVHGSIIFIDGVVSSAIGNLLVVDAGATTSGASDNSHVDGLMRKVGADNFEFPVGDQGVWAPIEITNVTAAVNFDAEYFFTNHADLSVIPPLQYRSSLEFWTLDPSAATTADVTLHWKNALRSGINTFTSDLVVAHYDGADWESYGNDFMVAADPGEVRADAVSVFSPFTFGSLSNNITVNPLPIDLVSFEAHPNGNQVDLKWVTASEIENDYFVVEKSKDGINFEKVVEVSGAGNSSNMITYFDIDPEPFQGLSYYRLKQVDYNEDFTYSQIVPVKFDGGNEVGFDVYPNPVGAHQNQVNLNLIGFEGQEILVILRDITGKEFYSKVEVIESGSSLKAIPISRDIPSGVYLVTATSNNSIYSRKLIIE